LDQVFISQLETYCIIGINRWEREVLQKVCLDLVLECDCREAGEKDDVSAAVDYKAVAKEVLQLVEGSGFLLVEALAEAVAQRILQNFPRVAAVQVTVSKPGAVRFAREVGVRITRSRQA